MTKAAKRSPQSRSDGSTNRGARAAALLVLALAGAVQCWRYRHVMYPDGIQYLDMARLAIDRGAGWLVNAYWSPLYPALLAAALRAIEPGAYWMYPVVQLVNFLAYLGALASFDVLLRTILAVRAANHARFTDRQVVVGSAALFAACVTYAVNVRTMTPDMIVAAATLATAALVLRGSSGTPRAWAWAGAALAVAYLAKAVMFPIALLFITGMIVREWRRGAGVGGPALALGMFLMVAAPLVAATSVKTGRFTFGESGRINYAWYVNGWGADLHWRGIPPESGVPVHPLQRLGDRPPAFGFPYPAPVTYALFFDPFYWTDGVRTRVDVTHQLAALRRTAREMTNAVLDALMPIAIVLIGAAVVSTRAARGAAAVYAPLVWLAAIPLLVYLPIHVEARFIGASLLLLTMTVLASLTLGERALRWSGALIAALVAAAAIVAGPVAAGAARHVWLDVRLGESHDPAPGWQIAEALHALGIGDDSDVAAIGPNLGADWAQLARVHIVAEIGPADRAAFLALAADARRDAVLRLSANSTRAVVADARAAAVDAEAIDLGDTGYSVVLPRHRVERYARGDGHVQ